MHASSTDNRQERTTTTTQAHQGTIMVANHTGKTLGMSLLAFKPVRQVPDRLRLVNLHRAGVGTSASRDQESGSQGVRRRIKRKCAQDLNQAPSLPRAGSVRRIAPLGSARAICSRDSSDHRENPAR